MTADRIRKFFVIAFVLLFFTYLFGPLLLMSVSAFNSSAFPRVSPFECFTVEWFRVLAEDKTLNQGAPTLKLAAGRRIEGARDIPDKFFRLPRAFFPGCGDGGEKRMGVRMQRPVE